MIIIDDKEMRFKLMIENINQLNTQVKELASTFENMGSKNKGKLGKEAKDAEDKFKSLTQQIKEAEKEALKLFTMEGNSNAFRAQAEEVRGLKNELMLMQSYTSPKLFAEPFEKALTPVQKVRGEISALRNELVVAKATGNMELAGNIEREIKDRQNLVALTKEQAKQTQQTIAQQISFWKNSAAVAGEGTEGWKKAEAELKKLYTTQTAVNKLGKDIGTTIKESTANIATQTTYLGSFMQKLRSHFNWILAGTAIAATGAIPMYALEQIKKIEQAMAGMMQVIPELHTDQKMLNEETMKFLDIAAVYGEKVEDIIKAGQLWGRMYKDLNTVNALVHQSAVLAVADNFSLVEANKALEAAMFQYGLVAKNSTEALAYSGKVIDIWTKLAHNAGVSAQDLAMAVERSGSVARMTGVDFEFLNAMIATAVRSTGRSGAEIGNMIKSVLGSIHSDKAIKEIEAMGIATKKIGNDGTIELRKAQDVLLDIAIAAQGSEKNLEDLFKGIAGGKWQWAKTAAMLGDYQEFIRTWGEAVNSTGFSASQVEMQLDTLARKIQKLSTDTEKLVMGMGNAGLTQYFKEQVTGLSNFVIGLQRIPAAGWQAIGTITMIAPALYVVGRALMSLNTAIVATDVATTALARKNILVASLVALSYVVYSLAENYGALANAARDADQRVQDNLAVKAQEVNMYEQQGQLIEALISAHQKLSAQIDNNTLSTEKVELAKKNLSATEVELTKLIGEQGVANLKAAEWSEEAADKEKTAHAQKTKAIKDEIKALREQQIQYTEQQIQSAQNRVDALANETKAWSFYAKALALVSEQYAGIVEKQISVNKWLKEKTGQNWFDKQIAIDEAKLAEIKAKAYKPVTDEISALSSQITNLKLGLKQQQLANIDFNPTKPGGENYDPTDKDKGKNKLQDNTQQIQDKIKNLELKRQEKQLELDLKLAEDRHKIALSDLGVQENLYGDTLDNKLAKMEETSKFINQLEQQLKNEASFSEDLETRLTELIKQYDDLNTSFGNKNKGFSELTKSEQRETLKLNKDLLSTDVRIQEIFTLWVKVQSAISGTTVKVEELKDSLSKISTPGWFNDEQVLKRQRESLQRQQDAELIKNRNKYDPYNEREQNQIKLNYMKKDRELAYQEELLAKKNLDDAIIALEKKRGTAEENELTIQVEKTRIAWELKRNIVLGLNKEIEEAEKAKNEQIRGGLAGIVEDFLINGNSLRDIWKNLWADLAREAIYRMFQVKTQASVLGSIFSLFGGGTTSSIAAPNIGGPIKFHSGGVVGVSAPRYHSGGDIVPYFKNLQPNEQPIIAQSGEEVNSIGERRTISYLSENMNNMMILMQNMMEKMQNISGQPIIINAVDTQSFADALQRNGSTMVDIIRQQGGLNNRV